VNTERVPPPPHRTAGIVTRLLAAGIDVVAVLLMMVSLYFGLAGLRFLWSPAGFRWPSPSLPHSILLASVLAFWYFAVAWATTGRTYGAAVLGLRVLSRDHRVLGWIRAGVRAVACVVFPAGLLWVTVSRHRRSMQDVFVRSVVVYDWYHHRGAGARGSDAPVRMGGAQPPPERVEAQPRHGALQPTRQVLPRTTWHVR
jgi:uncharacterized RDD family membrane protein YckC